MKFLLRKKNPLLHNSNQKKIMAIPALLKGVSFFKNFFLLYWLAHTVLWLIHCLGFSEKLNMGHFLGWVGEGGWGTDYILYLKREREREKMDFLGPTFQCCQVLVITKCQIPGQIMPDLLFCLINFKIPNAKQ